MRNYFVFILFLISHFCLAQPNRIDLQTASKLRGVTGISVVVGDNDDVGVSQPGAGSLYLRSNAGNTAFEWVTVSTPSLSDILTADPDAGGLSILNLFGIYDAGSKLSYEVDTRMIYDPTGTKVSLDGANRELLQTAGTVAFDWENFAFPTLAGGGSQMVTVDNSGNIGAGAIPTGDVVGPGSSVTDRIATFNGTTGKLIQDGGKTINDILYPTVSTKTSDYTLVLADALNIIEGNTATSLKITVPLNSSVAYPIGTVIDFASRGVGKVYLEATGGVTIYSLNSYLGILASGGTARLTKTATDSWYFSGDITDAYDADAAAYFLAVTTAGGSFTVNEKAYINTIVLALKAGGVWTKTHYLHLYMGGTSASMKLNVKNPVDTDAGFRLTFVNSPTLNANGCTFNGTTQYINTHYVPSTYANQNDKAYAFNWRTVGTNGANFGTINSSFNGDELLIVNFGATTGWAVSKGDDTFTRGGTYNGFYLLNRTTSTAASIKRNDVSLDTDAGATNHNSAQELYIGARNRQGVGAEVFSADNIDFDWCGTSLTSGEATALYNACAALQTSLGR